MKTLSVFCKYEDQVIELDELTDTREPRNTEALSDKWVRDVCYFSWNTGIAIWWLALLQKHYLLLWSEARQRNTRRVGSYSGTGRKFYCTRPCSNANDRMQGSVLINPCQPTPDQTRVFFKRPYVSWWREGGKNDTPQDKLICPWNDQAISQCIGKLVLVSRTTCHARE